MLLILSGALIFPSSMLTSKWRMCYEWIHLEVKHFFARSAWYCSKRHHISIYQCKLLHKTAHFVYSFLNSGLWVFSGCYKPNTTPLFLPDVVRHTENFLFQSNTSLTNDFLKPILECYMYLNQIIANGAGICQNILKCYLQYFHIHRPLYDKKITHDAYIWWQFVHNISFWQKSCMLFWRRKKNDSV